MHELQRIYRTYPLTIRDVAKASNVDRSRVQQLVNAMSQDDIALFVGQTWRLKTDALDWMKNRQNRRK